MTSLAAGFDVLSSSSKSSTGVWLSQVKPQGYLQNSDMWGNGGTAGQFNIQLLSSQGQVVGTYNWVHTCENYDPDDWDDNAHWNGTNGLPIEVTGASNDRFIKSSDGLYFKSPSVSGDDPEAVYTASSSGQIVTSNLGYTFLADGGFQCIGNPYPTSIKLSSIVPTGYLENEDMWGNGGTAGQFNIQMLSSQGQVGDTYNWVHTCENYDPDDWDDNAHWNDPSGKQIPGDGTGANDLVLTQGMGIYFKSPSHQGDDANDYTFTFTYPIK